MNAEVIELLQQAMETRTLAGRAGLGAIDIDALAEALAPKLAARMRKPQS
jgi:hypothetical protein